MNIELEFDMGSVPRTIFTYWHQGFSEAPAIVQACVQQLTLKNPGWQVHKLNQHSVHDFVRPPPISSGKLANLGLAARSDILRTQLLIEHGGVWVDPTVWVTQPFDNWLPEKCNAGLFLFSRPGRDRLISSWFIAAVPQHPILIQLFEELCTYWEENNFRNLGRSPSGFEQQLERVINRNLEWPGLWFSFPMRRILCLAPYFWFHYLFYRVLKKNEELRRIFTRMPDVSADGPHALQRFGLNSQFDSEAERVLKSSEIPLHKLTYKKDHGGRARGTVLEFLITAADAEDPGRLD